MQAYKKEMAQLAEMATTLMENMSDKPSTFTSATHVEHIRAMFKVWRTTMNNKSYVSAASLLGQGSNMKINVEQIIFSWNRTCQSLD